jgi:murein DD-endopeptidase MepM/ murein hydrolase activator NlpD
MNRFGKAIVALLILAGIAIASMVRFGKAAPVPPPVATAPAAPLAVAPSGLVIPVAGVQAADLADTFGDARTGHVHGALDIMAPRGTPVIAAMPGRVEKIFESEAGGHTVYVRSGDGRWISYYAHLDGYAPELAEGQAVARGGAIGTVGFTGNADPAGPHLHFEIKAMAPGEDWSKGRALNPFPLLTGR